MNEYLDFMENFGNRKKDNQILNNVSKIKSDISTFLKLSEEATTFLLNYYKTDDENWYNKYENTLPQLEDYERKFKLIMQNLSETVK